MRRITVFSAAALISGLVACSQAPAKAAEADTQPDQAEASEEASTFNISFPGEEQPGESTTDTGGFNFNIPDSAAPETGGFNLPTPEDDAAALPAVPESDVVTDLKAEDDEPLIRID